MAITADLAAKLVAEQFPRWAGLPVRRVEPGGWDNVTFRLGADLSVRLPSGPGYAPARGRGWALWKAMIVLVDALQDDPEDAIATKKVIAKVLSDNPRT